MVRWSSCGLKSLRNFLSGLDVEVCNDGLMVGYNSDRNRANSMWVRRASIARMSASGTTGIAALMLDRSAIGCELKPEFVDRSIERLREQKNEKVAAVMADPERFTLIGL
jgi:hypothetical protein